MCWGCRAPFGGNLIKLLNTVTDRGMCKQFKVANSIFIITLVNQSHGQGCMSPLGRMTERNYVMISHLCAVGWLAHSVDPSSGACRWVALLNNNNTDDNYNNRAIEYTNTLFRAVPDDVERGPLSRCLRN